MNWFNNLKITQKLLFSFIFLSLIIAIGGYFSIKDLKSAEESDTILYQNNTVPLQISGEISTFFQRMRNNGLVALTAGNNTERNDAITKANARMNDIANKFSEIEKINLADESKNAATEAKKSYEDFLGKFKNYLSLVQSEKKEEAKTIWTGVLEESRKNVQSSIEKLNDVLIKRAKNRSDNNTLEAEAAIRNILIKVVFVVLLTIGFGFYLSKIIGNPIKELTQATLRFAKGETNVNIDVKTKDEIGDLAKAFNAMIEKIGIQIQYLDNIPSPVMVVDKEFNIQFMNKFGASLGNKTPEQVINTKCYNHFKTKDCNTEKCAVARAMRNNKIEYSETDAKPLNTEIPIAYTGGPIKDKEGKIIGGIEVVTDLTKAKEYENYLDKNVKKLMVEMDKFADGDLTVEIIPEKEDDIIGKLFSQFTLVVKKIKGVINSLTEAVHATASASNQISSSTEELAAGTQEQSAQTGEIASAVNQMTATIVQTTRHAGEAASTAKQAGDNAKKGGEAVEKTIEGINKVAKVVTRAAGVVDELGKGSEQIGEIVQVIDDIADQTNLLALNAAIEAARAGEQGRGFAVVADEVRKLAERTTKATKEIANMIKKIQVDTKEAVTSMNEGTKEVEVGITLAQGAGEALQQIIEGVVKVSDIINQVAAASEEQSSAAEQISKNIESITNVTHETASGTQQIARAAEDLNRLTNNLQDLIQQFKVDNGGDSKYYVKDNGKLLIGNKYA